MAVLPFDLDEEERRRQEQAGAAAGAAGQVAGAPDTSPGGAPAGGDTPTGGSPQSKGTSGWTDVNAYLDANQEQAVGTANKIAGRLGEQATSVRNDIDTAKTGFQKKVSDNTVALDEDLTNRAFAKPEDFTKNADDVAKFKKMRDAQYGGPSSFQDADEYTSLLQKIDEANQKAKGVDTEAGREALLASVMTNPTKGMTALDNLLIGGNKDARNILTESAKPFAELSGYLDAASKEGTDAAAGARATTEATSKTVRDRLSAAPNEFQTALDAKVQSARDAAKANMAKEPQLLNNLKAFYTDDTALSDSDLKLLGMNRADAKAVAKEMVRLDLIKGGVPLTYSNGQSPSSSLLLKPGTGARQPDSWKEYFDPSKFDVNSFLSQTGNPDAEIGRGNVASAEDYARLAALAGLADADYGSILNPSEAGNAGTAGSDFESFNFGGARDTSRALFDSAVKQWANEQAAWWEHNKGAMGYSPQYSDPNYWIQTKTADSDRYLGMVAPPSKPMNPPTPPPATPLPTSGDGITSSTGGSPTGNGQPYNEADKQTWTLENHPANATWMNGYGWVTMMNYQNPPRR